MIITFEELQAFLDEQFPQGEAYGTLQKLGDGWAEMKLEVDGSRRIPVCGKTFHTGQGASGQSPQKKRRGLCTNRVKEREGLFRNLFVLFY